MKYKFRLKPYKHQLTALEKSWNKQNYAYFMEMGTGKTKVLIDNMSMLYDKGKIDGALIIAPKGVVKTWYEQELPVHLPKHIENVTILWQSNITKSQQEKLDSLFEIETALHILVMNVEAFSTDKGVKFAAKFLNSHKTLMAVDESTTVKTPTATKTKTRTRTQTKSKTTTKTAPKSKTVTKPAPKSKTTAKSAPKRKPFDAQKRGPGRPKGSTKTTAKSAPKTNNTLKIKNAAKQTGNFLKDTAKKALDYCLD